MTHQQKYSTGTVLFPFYILIKIFLTSVHRSLSFYNDKQECCEAFKGPKIMFQTLNLSQII